MLKKEIKGRNGIDVKDTRDRSEGENEYLFLSIWKGKKKEVGRHNFNTYLLQIVLAKLNAVIFELIKL